MAFVEHESHFFLTLRQYNNLKQDCCGFGMVLLLF